MLNLKFKNISLISLIITILSIAWVYLLKNDLKNLYLKFLNNEQDITNLKNIITKFETDISNLSVQNSQNYVLSNQLLQEINKNDDDPNISIKKHPLSETSDLDEKTLKNILDNVSNQSSSESEISSEEQKQLTEQSAENIPQPINSEQNSDILELNDLNSNLNHDNKSPLEELKNSKLESLKEKCKYFNISTKGTKEALASRIHQHTKSQNN